MASLDKEKFKEDFTQLELVVMNVHSAIFFLRRSFEDKVPLTREDTKIVREGLTHYVINKIAMLFDDDRRCNSLSSISRRYKKGPVPHDLFDEYDTEIKNFCNAHKEDLDRIRENRNLMTAHLGSGEKKRLGLSTVVADTIRRILGVKVDIAKSDDLMIITTHQLLYEMPISHNFEEVCRITNKLHARMLHDCG